jgi:flagellar biosynthesis protein FlhG
MRSNIRVDQAEGLRRLLVRNHTQVVTLASGKPRVGCTSTTVNLAAAMAHCGKEVLVLDENQAPNNCLDHLGLFARYDLLDVVQEKCKPSEAVLSTGGFSILSTARAVSSLAQLNHSEKRRLENALAEVSKGVDVMLVDAPMLAGQAEALSISARGVSLLVVVDATTSGITDSYSLIKRLALENACLQFEIVVNKVTDEQAAMAVFGNMAKVAWCNLAARLEYLGYIPRDDRLKHAARLAKPVVDAFPAAISAKSYLMLSEKLLNLPMLSETEGGVHTIIQNLMRQVSQPLQQHGKKVEHVVNC